MCVAQLIFDAIYCLRDCAYKTLSGPGEVQQGPGVSSSDYEPPSILRSARRPQQGHQAPINRAFIEKYCAPWQAQGEASQ